MILATIVFASVASNSVPLHAQSGQLIENLFRTWANQELEKHRPSNGRQDPFGPSPATRPPDRDSDARRNIQVGSGQAAEYARQLTEFDRQFDALLASLRQQAARNGDLRRVLPAAYEVSATVDSLIDRLDGLRSLSVIESAHRSLDQRYRQLSFQIRSLSGLDRELNDRVRRCDRACSEMSRLFGMRPQFDRAALRDVMVTASTYMQALLDDLELASLDRGRVRSLQHEGRLLRQQLIDASGRLDTMSYEDCVSRFTDFVARWGSYRRQIDALRDPHLDRRLDRISDCGDQTYALLWMPPPGSNNDVAVLAGRIHDNVQSISRSLTFLAMSQLPADQQRQLTSALRELVNLADDLQRRSQQGEPDRVLRERFTDFDRIWSQTRPILADVRSLPRDLVSQTDRNCQQLRDRLQLDGGYQPSHQWTQWLAIAASLESNSESLRKTLEGYARSMEPASYRDTTLNAARDFHREAREIHELISRIEQRGDRGETEQLRQRTQSMLDAWTRLSGQLVTMESHGLVGPRSLRVRRTQQALVPAVGQLAAALLPR
ncbi:hypothetical protein FYK55_05535 [Roseiconus nitratireducens]|uniref:Uncharacterized protein n=1 Tax=Roseiconus nitratireducens TaxID=2605748 RepID=A0A5M6DC52_9BACT|nr:hypothetical protein [Roseiconus nitratireducens]KAA5545138.1 hypothetical protein FYK55_05535 [Roseiconus nitratireducens]